MNLENLLLSEISQTQKEKHVCFHLDEIARLGEFTETESRLEATRGCEEGEMGNYCLNR